MPSSAPCPSTSTSSTSSSSSCASSGSVATDGAGPVLKLERDDSARSLRALEWLNAIVSDVRAGVGPYRAIYLRASRHWDPAHIGLALSAMDMASVLGETSAAVTDRPVVVDDEDDGRTRRHRIPRSAK